MPSKEGVSGPSSRAQGEQQKLSPLSLHGPRFRGLPAMLERSLGEGSLSRANGLRSDDKQLERAFEANKPT